MLHLERVIGHRGALGYAPENTLSSFAKAKALGCTLIEFDVMLSADGHAFVFHDETLQRTTNGRGNFDSMSAKEIQQLDAGAWFAKSFSGEKIPSLANALNWLSAEGVQANIEIKATPGQVEQTTIAVLTHLNQYWPHNKPWPIVSSFEHDALHFCKSIMPEIPLGLLLDSWQDNWLQMATDLQCYSIHFNKRALSKKRVQQIKECAFKLCAYTVNRKRQARRLLDWGVDAVFSDYPDLLANDK